MNTGMQSLVGNWFRKGDETPDEQGIPRMPPAIAMLPMPEQTEDEKRLAVIANAHSYVEQIKQERLADAGTIKQLQSEVGILTHDLQGERRKSGLLELDIAERDNTITTLQADIDELRQFFTLQVQINEKERLTYEKFGIKAPPKKERKPKAKKAKPQGDST